MRISPSETGKELAPENVPKEPSLYELAVGLKNQIIEDQAHRSSRAHPSK